MERPDETYGTTRCIGTGCGSLYLTYSCSDGYQEVFLRLGKTGGCASSFLDGIGRLITFALNAGVPVDTVVRAFKANRCHTPRMGVLSCVDAIAQLLEQEQKPIIVKCKECKEE